VGNISDSLCNDQTAVVSRFHFHCGWLGFLPGQGEYYRRETASMTIFDVQTEKITAFDTRNTCLFKMYFDENQLFKQLKTYYNKNKYRFEIPESDLNQVRQFFDKYYSGLTVLDHVEDYCVVVKKEQIQATY